MNGVIAAHDAILAWPPMRSTLLVEDIARNDELIFFSNIWS
jgi:hypothetical protein